jgi:hypothetical protein
MKGTIMEKAMTMLLYATAIAVGWGMLRYFRGRFAAGGLRAVQSSARNRKAYRRAIGRWENEGGAVLTHQNDPIAR